MKELINNILSRHYNVVHQYDPNQQNNNQENLVQEQQLPQNNLQHRRSLQATRGFDRGFSILDSLFQQRQAGKRARWPTSVFLLMIGGLCLISTGVLMTYYDPYDLIFNWKLQYEEGGEVYELWRNPPAEIFVKIYLFNITNADEFMAGKEKLKVEEIGPYVYKECFTHDNVTFNDNGTVSTIPRHPLVWQPEMSQGRSEDDIFMLPNIALLSIAQVVASKSYFVRLPINLVIRQAKEKPIVRMTAREFMFGYETTLTTLGNNILPNWIKFDKVGLIDRMYDFSGDFETMFSGQTNPQLSGLYDTYRGSTDLEQWDGEHCSKIQYASDGVKFKSFLQPNETVLFFRKNMCRAQKLVPAGNTVIGGLTASKYMFEENALDNGEINEKNKCYCRLGKCLPRGFIDVTDCYYGFPIALSYPHFMDADEKVQNMTEGMSPDTKKHESYFFINRESGLPLNVSAKFQINMVTQDISNMAHVEHFSNIVLPMLWFDVTMPGLPHDLQNRFIFYLNILPWIVKISLYFNYFAGALLLTWAFVKASRELKKNLERAHNMQQVISVVNAPCEVRIANDSEMQRILEQDEDTDETDQMIKRKSSSFTSTGSRNSSSGISSDTRSQDTDHFSEAEVHDDLTELKIVQNEPVRLYAVLGRMDSVLSTTESISAILDNIK